MCSLIGLEETYGSFVTGLAMGLDGWVGFAESVFLGFVVILGYVIRFDEFVGFQVEGVQPGCTVLLDLVVVVVARVKEPEAIAFINL